MKGVDLILFGELRSEIDTLRSHVPQRGAERVFVGGHAMHGGVGYTGRGDTPTPRRRRTASLCSLAPLPPVEGRGGTTGGGVVVRDRVGSGHRC